MKRLLCVLVAVLLVLPSVSTAFVPGFVGDFGGQTFPLTSWVSRGNGPPVVGIGYDPLEGYVSFAPSAGSTYERLLSFCYPVDFYDAGDYVELVVNCSVSGTTTYGATTFLDVGFTASEPLTSYPGGHDMTYRSLPGVYVELMASAGYIYVISRDSDGAYLHYRSFTVGLMDHPFDISEPHMYYVRLYRSGTISVSVDLDSEITQTLIFDCEYPGPYAYPFFELHHAHGNPGDVRLYSLSVESVISPVSDLEPVTFNVFPTEGDFPTPFEWHLNVLDGRPGAEPGNRTLVSENFTGSSATVDLPRTSVLNAHWVHVTAEGYDQSPAQLLFDVPAGGRSVSVSLVPRSPPSPPPGECLVNFLVLDADDDHPLSSALVNVGGVAKYTGSSGLAWFKVPSNDTYSWVATCRGSYWASGGNVSVGDEDVDVVVRLVRKDSDLPRPPIPEIPGMPVIHPSLDPSVFRSQILAIPLLSAVASPFLDFIDSFAAGVSDFVDPVLDIFTDPLQQVSSSMASVGEQIQDSLDRYVAVSAVLLGSVGTLLSAFPDLVLGLVSYGLLLDLVYLLLRGGL